MRAEIQGFTSARILQITYKSMEIMLGAQAMALDFSRRASRSIRYFQSSIIIPRLNMKSVTNQVV
jgi:hypothetical protein